MKLESQIDGRDLGAWSSSSSAQFNIRDIWGPGAPEFSRVGTNPSQKEDGTMDLTGTAFKKFELPDSWSKREERTDNSVIHHFQPKGSDSEICAMSKSITPSEAKQFETMLNNQNGVQVLMPDKIRTLSSVMGSNTVGDNQYTNKHAANDPEAPAFNLKSAQLLPVNGKTVLEVDGEFRDASGKATKYFRGIYAPDANGSGNVRELYMQTSTRSEYLARQNEYKKAVNSLEW